MAFGPRRFLFARGVQVAGIITALKRQIKNEHRVNVELDGAFAFALTDLQAASLRIGQYLGDEAIAALRRDDLAARVYDQALRFLTYRPRSIAEMTHHLQAKAVPEELIAATIQRLEQAGLLDDAAFARYWIENRENFRPRAARALRCELRRKGLAEDTIAAALAPLDEEDSAYRLAASQAQRLRHADAETFRRRLGSYLARRGYDYEIVRDTVERLWREHNADEA